MKHLFSAAIMVILLCGCDQPPHPFCKDIETNKEKLNELKQAIDSKEKARADSIFNDVESFYKNWPTSGENIQCLIDGNEKTIYFTEEEKKKNSKRLEALQQIINALR